MKVRERSSAALRALAFGAGRACADAVISEMVVMHAPGEGDCVRCCRRETDSARAKFTAVKRQCDAGLRPFSGTAVVAGSLCPRHSNPEIYDATQTSSFDPHRGVL